MSDLVERLQSHMGQADMGEVLADCRKAADAIERLMKALEPFAAEAGCYDPDTGDGDDTVWAIPAYFKIRDLRRARAALDAIKEG